MRKVLRVVLLAIVALLIYASTRPDTFHVERTGMIGAPPEVVYAHVVSFHAWPAWSPWEKLDPNMKREFGGTDGAVGSSYAWVGNDNVGTGKMTITEATPASKVDMKLEFIKPFKATNTATFALAPEGAGTKVTWAMDGKNDLMGKIMSIFMNMDKMVGGDFERGLVSLKAVSEAGPPAGS